MTMDNAEAVEDQASRIGRGGGGRACVPSWLRLSSLLLMMLGLTDLHSVTTAKREDDPIVRTQTGHVRGKRIHMTDIGKTVDVYMGIPYAQPPVKHLRFRHPQPIQKWDHVHDATRLPHSCYQEPDLTFGKDFYGSTVWNSPTDISEDCLFLNVFVPRPRQRKLAVMVWIYGGGFYSGTTTLDLYDGKLLAALNNVVVVSIAYRLGALGFLSLNHPSAPGNMGLFDQLMGLDWVQQNIRYFGGDADNVTLFGESAGSVSVSLHLLSPLSHNKFHRAILQSGSANMPWATLTIEESKRRSVELAVEILSCNNTDDMAELADCLRAVPVDKIVELQWVSRGIMQFPFLPVIDGVFLTASPNELLHQKSFKRCPIITGSNQNEGSFFLIYELKAYLDLDRKSMTQKQYEKSMDQLFYYYPQYPVVVNENGLRAIKFQYTDWEHQEDSGRNVHALDMAVGDSQFLCPLNSFALAYAKAQQKVFMYYFTQRYSSNPWPVWMGVLHGDEIFFSFGEALKTKHNFTEDERQLSKKMINYWGNFAKTGDPNMRPGQSSLDEWPIHTTEGREYLELNTQFIDNKDKWKAIERGPRIKECAFWTEYLPHLINITSSDNQKNGNNGQSIENGCYGNVSGSHVGSQVWMIVFGYFACAFYVRINTLIL